MRAGAGVAAAAAGTLGAAAAAAAKLALGTGGNAAGGPVRKEAGGAGRPKFPCGRPSGGTRCSSRRWRGRSALVLPSALPGAALDLLGKGGGLGERSRDSLLKEPSLAGLTNARCRRKQGGERSEAAGCEENERGMGMPRTKPSSVSPFAVLLHQCYFKAGC